MIPIHRGARAGAAVAITATAALILAGCSSSSADEPSTAATDAASAPYYDMLPDYVKEAGVIKAGALFQTPPGIGASDDDPNVAVGIVPDLAALVEPLLGVDVEFVNTQWPNQLPGVQSGALDVLWGQTTDTAEREQSVVDMVPWSRSSSGLLVAAGNPKGIDSIASMCGLKAAVPLGSSQLTQTQAISDSECVAKGQPAIEVLEYQGGNDAIQAVRAGTVDSWMDSYVNLVNTAADSPDVFEAVEIPESEMAADISAISVSKDNPGLSEALAAAIKDIVTDGDYAGVFTEWKADSMVLDADEIVINPITGTPVGESAAS